MKTIKFFVMAFAAVLMTANFAACSKDDNNGSGSEQQKSNFERYMSAVVNEVQSTKAASGNNKAILLVAFGSTWENAHDTFKKVVEDYQTDEQFKGYDVYFSFTSAICINRSRGTNGQGEHYASQNFYSPNFWLEAIGRQKYEEVRVQSLHIIPGEEFLRLRDTYIKDFKNNVYADLDEKYLEEGVKIFIGGPLMAEEDDVQDVANVLDAQFNQYVQDGNGMVFLGHGNPAEYNYGNGNVRYTQLEARLREKNPNYFVATVDMEKNLLEDLWNDRMAPDGNKVIATGKTITLHALMSIAGDHAHNDMSGIENEGDSWREFFQQQGYTCNYDGNDGNAGNNCILNGLGDYAEIRKIWKQHTLDANEMFAEEEEEE
ncbi:MAG: sirohydrochlorin cobaltochelatase [Bacteroidaceae bacterium]|nr:sirohydrochlorin cobaltochelatase [Bacteroidaceae bacterium]